MYFDTKQAFVLFYCLPESSSENRPVSTTIREHFVFAEISGVLHHFWVEGSVVHEGAKLPSESSLTTISCIAWKGETLVMADSDGNLGVWDLKAKISRLVLCTVVDINYK